MIFHRTEKVDIDGVRYELTNKTKEECYNYKMKIAEIYEYFNPDNYDMTRTQENYIEWKKELIKHLKEFDKMYVKHVKESHPEINTIH